MAGETTFCPNCGKANPIGMRFCGHCGAALQVPTEEPEPVPASSEAESDREPTQKLEAAASAVAAPAVSALPVSTPPASVPKAPPILTVPEVDVVVPTDPIARERERDRLLSLASLQRMRAQILDARASLQKAIIVSEGMPGSQTAPIYEMLGDMLAAEERWEQAAESYERAQHLDPTRSSAERKFGEMTLRIADEKAMAKLGGMIGSENSDTLSSGSKAKRNPGFAMILSLIVPGFGQFYNGQLIKGCVCLGVFVLAMFIISFTPDVKAIRCLFSPMAKGCTNLSVSPMTWLFLFAAGAAWLYSLVDAPMAAAKTEDHSGTSGPVVDKTGWEV